MSATEGQNLCANCNWIKRFEQNEKRGGKKNKIIKQSQSFSFQ